MNQSPGASTSQFVECINFRALCNIIKSRTRDNIDVNQAEKDMTLAKCVSSQQSWAVKLCQHWGDVISARCADITNDRAETMLAFVQLAPHDLRWHIALTNSKNFLHPNANLPCTKWFVLHCVQFCWRHWAQFFFAACQACLQGAALLAGFGASRKVFIPKSTDCKVITARYFGSRRAILVVFFCIFVNRLMDIKDGARFKCRRGGCKLSAGHAQSLSWPRAPEDGKPQQQRQPGATQQGRWRQPHRNSMVVRGSHRHRRQGSGRHTPDEKVAVALERVSKLEAAFRARTSERR